MHQKVCKGCKTQAEAYAFVSALPLLFVEEKIMIAKIAEWMYIPGGLHMERNNLLTVVNEVYAEASFYDLPYIFSLMKDTIALPLQTIIHVLQFLRWLRP